MLVNLLLSAVAVTTITTFVMAIATVTVPPSSPLAPSPLISH